MAAADNILPKDGVVQFFNTLLSQQESDKYFATLLENIIWRQEPIIIFGKSIMQPRFTAWYGDEGTEYSYSGIRMKPLKWTSALLPLKEKISAFTGVNFNSALLNLYRNGNDSMGWHRDNEKELNQNPIIASVSFGAQRKFLFRHISDKSAKVSINLSHGSLLLMSEETQHFWYHCLPKTKKVMTPRINVTFRIIFP